VAADPAPLFVYGTLRFPEVVDVLIDRDPPRTPVTLTGWQVTALPDQPYPSIIQAVDQVADGELLHDVDAAEWDALDCFEAPGYLLTRVTTSAGPAYVYAAAPDHGLTPQPWSLDRFRADELPNYLDRCRSWRQRYDARQQ